MSELICGECKACCEWGGEIGLRPQLTLAEALVLENELITMMDGVNPVQQVVLKANDEGSCVYLSEEGCTNYANRPIVCKGFDCRDLYEDMKGKCFVEVLIKGKEISKG